MGSPLVLSAVRANPGTRATPAEKLLLLGEILTVYTAMRWRMPRGDIRDVAASSQAVLRRTAQVAPPPGLNSGDLASRLGRAVYRTLRILPTDSRCLVQSLVLSRMLSARGIPSTLVIGAHSRPDFTAHAWVEHDGRPVLPPRGYQDSRLVEL
jgi:hypothetical protein